MSDPFDSPGDRWGLVFYGAVSGRGHTRQVWAQIADAMAAADLAQHEGVRGDDGWCRVAVDTFIRLSDAGAYPHDPFDGPPRWQVDEPVVRAWLGAPTFDGDAPPQTLLEACGFHFWFPPWRQPTPSDVSLLVSIVEDVGVVGAPRHRVSVLTSVRGGVVRDDACLVLLWPPDGPARASVDIAVTDLVPATGSRADRVVGVLSAVATVANQLITAAEPAAPTCPVLRDVGVNEQPLRRGGRAFRLLPGGAGDPPPAPPRHRPPTPPQRHRR